MYYIRQDRSRTPCKSDRRKLPSDRIMFRFLHWCQIPGLRCQKLSIILPIQRRSGVRHVITFPRATVLSRDNVSFTINGFLPFVADPPPSNSTTDADTHPTRYRQPNFWLHGQYQEHNHCRHGKCPKCYSSRIVHFQILPESA